MSQVKQLTTPAVIAHRGESARFPENTRLALEQALQSGAAGVEFDVHLSKDLVPMVIHDKELTRTTACSGSVFDLTAEQLSRFTAGYSERFGDRFSTETIPSLRDIVALLRQWPAATPFVELKRASLRHYGVETMVDKVMRELEPLKDGYVLISYNEQALQYARRQGVSRIGWVFDHPTDQARQTAQQLNPEYLVSDADEVAAMQGVAPEILWPGDWSWMLFEVNDPDEAIGWAARGVEFIETNNVQTYTQHAAFTKPA